MRCNVVLVGLASLLVLPVLAADETSRRSLTFEERVAAQRAIEEVYWRHRIWPKENPGPKPPLSAVMSEEAIRAKVADYLKKSNSLDKFWHRPVTAEQLQAEMDRMAAHTRDGRVLKELFDALGNDPFLIAETLTRQTLVDRLASNWYAFDDRFNSITRDEAEHAVATCTNIDCMKSMGGEYREVSWTRSPQSGEEWVVQTRASAPVNPETSTASLSEFAADLVAGCQTYLPIESAASLNPRTRLTWSRS